MGDDPKVQDPLTEIVAANVKRLRERAGLSQEELGEAAGLNKNTINRLERLRSTIELPTLREIAQALKVDVTELVTAHMLEVDVVDALKTYVRSKWKKIDKPGEAELLELARLGTIKVVGAQVDDEAVAEAVHAALLSSRERQAGEGAQ